MTAPEQGEEWPEEFQCPHCGVWTAVDDDYRSITCECGGVIMKPGVKPMTEPERTADAAAKDALDLLRVYLNRDVTMETQRLVSDAYDVLDRAMEGPRFGDDVREQADAADWRRRFIGRFRREPASP